MHSCNNLKATVAAVLVFAASFFSVPEVNAGESIASPTSFSVPLADKTSGVTRTQIGSAFLVEYRESVFLLTNAHVILNAGITHQFAFKYNDEWVSIGARWTFTSVDVVAVDVTALVDKAKAGTFRVDSTDLVLGKSQLTAVCNPDESPQLFTGTYSGVEADRKIELRFIEKGILPYCSGAPVVDGEFRIRAIVTSGSAESVTDRIKWGYAIPADVITRFLDEKFFSRSVCCNK